MIKIISSLVDIFSKENTLMYTKADDGAMYVSNGNFLGKISQKDFGELLSQLDRRKRKYKIELVERDGLKQYANEVKGNFEVSQPYEHEQSYGAMCVFADKIQHFAYNKKFLDAFDDTDNRMFIDDNLTFNIKAHNLVIKNGNGEFVGLILPLNLTDENRKQLNDVFPLENGFKTTIERIKENPANDPYIGKEFFDGTETHIISAIQKSGDTYRYVVPLIENGELSRCAGLIDVDKIENEIEQWEIRRVKNEKQKAVDAVEAQKEAEKKAVFENTDGYADNQPPMQKARTLKALNSIFPTKEYGRLSVKDFLKAALADGKTLEIRKTLKEKYAEMNTGEYFRGIVNKRDEIEAHSKFFKVHHDRNPDDSNALWLKENHPYLHYCCFHDKNALPENCFKTEYRVKIDQNSFFPITKTAYDYGIYLWSRNRDAQKPQRMAEQMEKGAKQAAKHNAARPAPIKGKEQNAER